MSGLAAIYLTALLIYPDGHHYSLELGKVASKQFATCAKAKEYYGFQLEQTLSVAKVVKITCSQEI